MRLDDWLAKPAVRTVHRRESSCDVAELWACAGQVRLGDCRLLGRLVRARIPDLRPDVTFRELFHDEPFILLEEGPAHTVSALCGRIWSVRRDFATLSDPAAFRTWQVPGTVRVVFAHWAQATAGGAELVSEVRVAPVDRRARIYLRGMEPFIGAFQGLVGAEALNAAVRRAEVTPAGGVGGALRRLDRST